MTERLAHHREDGEPHDHGRQAEHVRNAEVGRINRALDCRQHEPGEGPAMFPIA